MVFTQENITSIILLRLLTDPGNKNQIDEGLQGHLEPAAERVHSQRHELHQGVDDCHIDGNVPCVLPHFPGVPPHLPRVLPCAVTRPPSSSINNNNPIAKVYGLVCKGIQRIWWWMHRSQPSQNFWFCRGKTLICVICSCKPNHSHNLLIGHCVHSEVYNYQWGILRTPTLQMNFPLQSFSLYTTFKSGIAAASEPIPSD